jgi:hypothetical protein
MGTYGERRYSSTILDLGTMWRYVVSFMIWMLYPGKRACDTHRIQGRLGPRARLGATENLTPTIGPAVIPTSFIQVFIPKFRLQ